MLQLILISFFNFRFFPGGPRRYTTIIRNLRFLIFSHNIYVWVFLPSSLRTQTQNNWKLNFNTSLCHQNRCYYYYCCCTPQQENSRFLLKSYFSGRPAEVHNDNSRFTIFDFFPQHLCLGLLTFVPANTNTE